MFKKGFLLIVLTALIFLDLSACGSSGGSDDSGDSNENNDPVESTVSIQANCGVIVDGMLENEKADFNIEQVRMEAITPDRVIVTRLSGEQSGNSQLVKQLGIGSGGISQKLIDDGNSFLSSISAPYGYMLSPIEPEQEYIDPSGASGIYGQLFDSNGNSLAEELIQSAYAFPEVNGLFSDQLYDCYSALPVRADSSDAFSSKCGAFLSGSLTNPVKSSNMNKVSVEPLSSDFVKVTFLDGSSAGTTIGVVLHGVSSNGVAAYLIEEGKKLISSLTSPQAYYLPAGDGCIFNDAQGNQATLAQLFSRKGKNINEELIAIGAVEPAVNGCSANQLRTCYSTITVNRPPDPNQPKEPVDSGDSDSDKDDDNGASYPDTEIDDFLWKPVSESNGNLVVLVNVRGVRVKVEGKITETLVDTGPSNGRGTTARGSRPGCSYGRDVKIRFFDSAGKQIVVKDGRKVVTVNNGCNRVEWKL